MAANIAALMDEARSLEQSEINYFEEKARQGGIDENLHKINELVLNGTWCPLEAYIALKRTETLLGAILDGIRGQALEEARKFGKSFEFKGVKIEVRNSAGKWDFSVNHYHTVLKEKLKDFERMCKEVGPDVHAFDPNGEQITKAVYTEGRETLFCTFKK